MKIKELMTRDCITAKPDMTLNDAAHLLWKHDCGSLPVVDEQRNVVGMVTDRDICMCAYHKGSSLKQLNVADAMSKQVLTCAEDDEISTAERAMSEAQVRRIPVVDREGRLRGLLCLAKIARASSDGNGGKEISKKKVGETLAAICQPTAGARAEI